MFPKCPIHPKIRGHIRTLWNRACPYDNWILKQLGEDLFRGQLVLRTSTRYYLPAYKGSDSIN